MPAEHLVWIGRWNFIKVYISYSLDYRNSTFFGPLPINASLLASDETPNLSKNVPQSDAFESPNNWAMSFVWCVGFKAYLPWKLQLMMYLLELVHGFLPQWHTVFSLLRNVRYNKSYKSCVKGERERETCEHKFIVYKRLALHGSLN